MKEYAITVAKKITDSDLISILCGVTSAACSYWCNEFKYDYTDYDLAKEKLFQADGKKSDICYEGVILQMLKDGNSVVFVDRDDDEEHSLDFSSLIKGIELYMSSEHVSSMDLDEWDDADFDGVIQYALFGEIVFS